VFANDSRAELRRRYALAWRKFKAQAPLEPLEAQLAALITEHPEYVAAVLAADSPAPAGRAESAPEASGNPFLHMGLHLALREQLSTDRPPGIAGEYRRLLQRTGDAHATEHAMIEVLAEVLWDAQRAKAAPDELWYLERLRGL
jgi:hypothetical protein